MPIVITKNGASPIKLKIDLLPVTKKSSFYKCNYWEAKFFIELIIAINTP